MKRIISVFLLLLFLIALLGSISGCGSASGEIHILDINGKEFALLKTMPNGIEDIQNIRYAAYVDKAINEAVMEIAESKNFTTEKAQEYLFENKCSIYTCLDTSVADTIKKSYDNMGFTNIEFGCAITDLSGNVIALESMGNDIESDKNYAIENTPPYSSFKPLGVYAPAVENGIAYWSKAYLDSPIKKLKDRSGNEYDWPANANRTYTNENVVLANAIKTSLNTVAVRCMQDLGVQNSFDFLKKSFDLELEDENKKAAVYGEEEIIGNVALGYFTAVSPYDMAGYYQIFATGGKYIKPHTVLKITDENNHSLYENKSEEKQVIKEQTAFIMNKMLQNVVSPGGTGEKARVEDIPVGGKTGTGDEGNWFVGFTPQYSCAVWHGIGTDRNYACDYFADIVKNLENKTQIRYPICQDIKQAAYCYDSGYLFSEKCRRAGVGFYAEDNIPKTCDKH